MIGNQIPRIRIEPDRVDTDGIGAAMLMEEYGVRLDDWQRMVLDCWLGKDASGHYTVTSAGLCVARQNGKNVAIEAREFYGLVINGERIIHNAHQVKTCKRAFYRLLSMFTDKEHPEITRLVKNIRRTNGEEGIELYNGGMIEFSARTRQASRGFDGISLVVFDEASFLTDEQIEAVMSVLSASATGTRQLIYTGTPPDSLCQEDVFRRLRKACVEASEKDEISSSSWHEWSVPDGNLEKLDTSDKKLWYQCNPALGVRLTEKFTEEEFKTLDKAGFARERLGWWNTPPSENIEQAYVIDKEAWQACVSDDPKPDGKTAYGVKFTADGSLVCLCGAVIPPHGKARISLIQLQPMGYGLNWLAEWLNERYSKASCVVIDGRNGAEVLVDKIADTWRFKGSIIRPSAMDLTASVGLLLNEIAEHDVTWYREQEVLNDSALSSTKRKIGQGFGFGGANSAPIEACALALWGAKTCKRDPSKKMKIG